MAPMVAWNPKANELFLEAAEKPPGESRDAFLNEACGADAELRAQVIALLEASERAGSFLESPPSQLFGRAGGGATVDQPLISEGPGTIIGPYKLLQQIGEGGFGVVFLAEQATPVRRRVALKVIKPGMDTREVIARFEAERQALALMDHPNIAKVYDAGATENGRPYFVMELVPGVPITEYCDECNLTTRERLELFITVCQAVQHAHQKGVIHRDIKPTNVLVAWGLAPFAESAEQKVPIPLPHNEKPLVKIIDFGVAKAINQQLTEHTLMTAFAQIVGTPLYMSPEQAELSPLGVDTRSDIYSLGVLLYELLTGTTPFDKDRLHSASYDELRRIIREEDPPRPSARISTLAADLASTVADRRRTDARRLSRQVRGELDWIVMTCLEKDRSRRYDSTGSLARDVERYLQDEPVQACPPSASYRLRKFAHRNKTLLAAGGAIAAALFIGLGLAMWMYFRATTESLRAQAAANLVNEMMGSASPVGGMDTDYTVRQLMIYDDIRIAYFLAATHRENEAAEFVRKADLSAKRLAQPAGLTNALYYVALMQLRLGDEAGYRANSKALFEVPVGDLEIFAQSRPIWTPCLGPHSLEDLNLLVARAEKYSANASPDMRHFALTLLGAALYRAGQYERANERLEESLAAYPSDWPGPFLDVINYQRLFLAMTKWQLGARDEARRLLAEVQAPVDKELESTSIVWNRRATLEVLRREAEALIQPNEPDEAGENESTNDK